MLKTISPATLEYRDGVPYSAAYGDVYYSADGGAGQSRHVFLHGCGLPTRWAGRARFVVLETGFGAGLNFLTTWAAWREDPARPAQLYFLSVEKHPFRAEDLARVHAQWPAYSDLSAELLASWPVLTPGFHRIALDGGRIQLTLMLGDAADCLAQVEAAVDAFYLDGFAPGVNPDLWQTPLFDALARLAKPGALAATYTVAAGVRQALAEAGFAYEKRPGYGRKRHCLVARFERHGRPPAAALPTRVAVVGAGVAGAGVAYALASRGLDVVVLERADAIAQGASGNPVGVFRPLVSRDDNRPSRLTRAAFLHDLRAWPTLPGVQWARCGVLHLAKDAGAAEKQRRVLNPLSPPTTFARWVERGEACELADWPVSAPGIFYPQAGWIAPATLCHAWLDHPGIQVRTGCAVARLDATAAGWRLCDESGEVLAEADVVVLANAYDVRQLAPGVRWPLDAVRGQITRLPAGSLTAITRVIAREGYVAPGPGGPLIGATYEHDDDLAPRASSDLANLARLEAILPGARDTLPSTPTIGRASLRATLPDRMPLLGAIDTHPGLYVAAGYASRGVVWAGLLGETLADLMTGRPLPLERDLMRAISPGRFARNSPAPPA
ncbi:MAG TPA: bifunctional tRNA (5-methylaminomethyl-2-thiouridine)(34)-methyltransferase MnmD/FAD-dependent 5-carboxymethylaminomethyl-2-thiouridine(34) oxidoreductase MnmC [Thiobacillaceae bacterium]|nr:bifunctional tRNA (5-methylaminomethyl-2-thiouridine)(34)-methyltransferase MnmD/FAD-dependent 5-carboxymethylaminomethyl-2-thiouridine(34) oxidoreductase MnmC [Thiobacillaceae bacterium]